MIVDLNVHGLGEHHALQLFLPGVPYYIDIVGYSGNDRLPDCGCSDAVESGYNQDQHVPRFWESWLAEQTVIEG